MAKMMGDFEAPAVAKNGEGGLSSEKRVARCERLIAGGMDADDAAFRCGFKDKKSFMSRRNFLQRKARESAEKSMRDTAPPSADEEPTRVEPDVPSEALAEEATVCEGVALKIGRVDGTFMQYERTEGGIRVMDQLGTLGMPHDATVWRAVLREMDMALGMLGK